MRSGSKTLTRHGHSFLNHVGPGRVVGSDDKRRQGEQLALQGGTISPQGLCLVCGTPAGYHLRWESQTLVLVLVAVQVIGTYSAPDSAASKSSSS